MQHTLEHHLFQEEMGNNTCLPTKESLMHLFFDMDFVENEENFRPDTLKKGFKNEAERVVTEILKKYKKRKDIVDPVDIIKDCIYAQTSSSGEYSACSVKTHYIYLVYTELYIVSVAIMMNN